MSWNNILLIILFIMFAYGGYYIWQNNQKCQKPLEYKIGFIDPRHNITKKDFLLLIKDAENIWEVPTEKNLFEYNKNADLTINLPFDKKQAYLDNLKNIKNDLDMQISQFKKERELLDELKKNYKNKLQEYNKSVERWNTGLQNNQKDFNRLKNIKNELDSLGKELDYSIIKFNNSVKDYNNNADNFNDNTAFEDMGGVTLGKTIINIFILNKDESDKYLVAHELGHAIGISGHGINLNSLMYSRLPKDIKGVSSEDIALINSVCSS